MCDFIRTLPAQDAPCGVGKSTTFSARFWSKVGRNADSECWPWLAHRVTGGYGQFKINGRKRQASHVAWELAHGRKMATGRLIRHTCDNPQCVNPAHLRASTQKHNVHDAIRKGRHVNPDYRLRRTVRNQYSRKAAA
jgi:hypothetical protein